MSADTPRRRRRAVEVLHKGAGRFRETRLARLHAWLAELVAELAPGYASLGVRWTGDRAMRELNRRFRGVDATTDVLSFPGGASPEGRYLGDVVISVAQARRQAAEHGHAVERELRILLLHGVLHCLGYDHERDRGEMERLERRLRRKWIPKS